VVEPGHRKTNIVISRLLAFNMLAVFMVDELGYDIIETFL